MSRAFLLCGPALLLGSCVATALADDTVSGVVGGGPSLDHLLALGPYGALVWGAYLLGRGMKITVQVELSDYDRALLKSLSGRGNPPEQVRAG